MLNSGMTPAKKNPVERTQFTVSFRSMLSTLIRCMEMLEFVLKFLFSKVNNLIHQSRISYHREWLTVLQLLHWIRMFFGNGEVMMKSIVAILSKLDTPCDFRLGPQLWTYIDRPEDIQVVLNNSKTLGKGSVYKFYAALGEGLLTSAVPKWKKHRRLITPIFNTHLLRNFFHVFNVKNKRLINTLKETSDGDNVIDLIDCFEPLTFDILCETMMSYDSERLIPEDEKAEYRKSVERLQEIYGSRAVKAWLHPDFIFKVYQKLKKYSKAQRITEGFREEIVEYKRKIYKEKITGLKANSNAKGFASKQEKTITFLDQLLELNEQGAGFTNKDLYDEVTIMLTAGTETSAKTDAFTLLMLAMHPNFQNEAYKEVIGVLGEEDRPITMDDVENMTFLEQCIKETLRLFPIAPFLIRQASDDLQIDSNGRTFLIKKGRDVCISPYLVHRDPNIYPNPLEWNPHNFSSAAMRMRHEYSFLAFSKGPRGCLGTKFAMVSMKMTISLILKNFRLTTDVELDDIRLSFDTLLKSVDGYKVKLNHR